jgi:HD-GYP domain-containing protein (c-di-GMP phosphodiesterase class II)
MTDLDLGEVETKADGPAVGSQNYCPLRTELLLEMSPLRADVYIQLSETKFLKLFRSGDVFTDGDLDKYKGQKGVEYLWLEKEQTAGVVKQFKEEIDRTARDGRFSVQDVAKRSGWVFQTVRDLSASLGVTPELSELTKANVEMTLRSVRDDLSLAQALAELKAEGGYIAAHSFSLAYLGSMIINMTTLKSEANCEKMAYAAFFHDMTLHNQELARVSSVPEFRAKADEKGFTQENQKTLLYHSVHAAEYSRKFKVPHDVETIILQHHERPNGSGFPRGVTHDQINPLSAVFIVAHELYDYSESQGQELASMEDFVEAKSQALYEGFFKELMEQIVHG